MNLVFTLLIFQERTPPNKATNTSALICQNVNVWFWLVVTILNQDFISFLVATKKPNGGRPSVATVLGYSDTTNAIKQHCKGVAKHHPIADPRWGKVRTYHKDILTELFEFEQLL